MKVGIDYLVGPGEICGIKINPIRGEKRYHVLLGFLMPRGFAQTAPVFSREVYSRAINDYEKRKLLNPEHAAWFRQQLANLPGLPKTEKEMNENLVRSFTGETGKNPAGVELVEFDPDFYRFWTSTRAKSCIFCNFKHAMKSVVKMVANGDIPTSEEALQIQQRIEALNLPVDIREAISRRTGVDSLNNNFVTGVERRGDKARLVPPCGAELPWFESREALRAMLRMFSSEDLSGDREEFDHIERQINLFSDFREDLSANDRGGVGRHLKKHYGDQNEHVVGHFHHALESYCTFTKSGITI